MQAIPMKNIELPEPLQEFLDIWSNAPRDKHPYLPCKDYFTPIRLGELTSKLAIAEYMGPRQLVLTYFGSDIERFSNIKAHNKNYYDFASEVMADKLDEFHQVIFGLPCGAYVAEDVHLTGNRTYVYETIQLPVADNEGEARFLMGTGFAKMISNVESDENSIVHAGNIHSTIFYNIGNGTPAHYVDNHKLIKK